MPDRIKRLLPLSGIVVVAAMAVVLTLPSSPDSNASGARVIAWYRSHHTEVYVSATLLAYTAAVAVLYFASVASFLRRRGSDLLATTTVIGGAIFAAGLLLATGASFAANDGPAHFTPDVAQTLNIIQSDVFAPMFLAGFAIATLSMGVAMLRTRCLPLALGIITTAVGVVAFSGILAWFAFLAGAPLTVAIAAYVYQRSGRPETVTLPDSVPAQRAQSGAASSTRTTVT
jgi:hypothetical protein